jgi:hypothetical protein
VFVKQTHCEGTQAPSWHCAADQCSSFSMGQRTPQPPQLFTSVRVSTQAAPQATVGHPQTLLAPLEPPELPLLPDVELESPPSPEPTAEVAQLQLERQVARASAK